MITNKDARRLVASMRKFAKDSEVSASTASELQAEWLKGRASAYRLGADWLEELILDDEETDNA